MNKVIYSSMFVLLFALLLPVFSAAQNANIAELLNKSDFTTLESLLAEEIDLCVMDDTQINTKSEAIVRIKNFLKKNPIKSIDTLHKGKSDEFGSKYNVYKILTDAQMIRAFVYYEDEGGTTKVKELRFDKF